VPKGLTLQFLATGTFSDATTQVITVDSSWASDAASVASVSDAEGSKGLATAVAVGSANISATLDGVSNATLMTVTVPQLQSITVTPANPSLLTLSSVAFKAVGNYSDGTSPDITSQVTWGSSNTASSTITASGTASTLLTGTATISASLGAVTGSTTLKATGGNLSSIVVSPLTSILVVNDSTTHTTALISATGTFSNGAIRDITGAVGVAWSTANANYVSAPVPTGNLAWLVPVAVTPTGTPINVTATSGTLTPSSCAVTVTAPALPLRSITISAIDANLTSATGVIAGTSSPLTATAVFSDGTSQDITASAAWTSDSSTITVNNTGRTKGRVTGSAAGSATITATYGGTSNTAIVKVRTAPVLQSLTINSGSAAVIAGNQSRFTATALFSDTTQVDVTELATWSIANTNVAILADSQNQPGQVVFVDSGATTLAATFSTKSATPVTITVP
jgi:hypothetical protein